MLAAILAFAGIAAVINVTPGLDSLLVLRASLSGGRAAGLFSGLGINAGCLAWGLAGAVYLAWLGCYALWRSRHRDARTPDPGLAPAESPQPGHPGPGQLAAFRSGLTTNLLNPKAGVFYLSLLPQFIPHGAPVFATSLLLTLVDVTELLIWFCVLSAAASVLAHRISRASFRRRMEQASGLVLIGFAVGLAVERT